MSTENNNSGTEQQKTTEEKVTFTVEQQARVDQIVREAMGRAGGEVRADLTRVTSEKAALEAELATAKAAAKAATTPSEKKEAKADVEALQNQLLEYKNAQATNQAELERIRKQIADKDAEIGRVKNDAVEIKKQVAMQIAAGKANFIEVGQATELTSKFVKFDETRNQFVVHSENGAERLNSSYEPMTLEEFYKEFADKNPHLVRGDAKGGAGSTQAQRPGSVAGKYEMSQIFGPKSNGALANKLAKENLPEYRRLKAQAIEAGILS